MQKKSEDVQISSLADLRKQIQRTRARINHREDELRKRFQQVPGELFYSGVDSMIPNILTGKISSFALNAGKGLINNFFVRKAATGAPGLLRLPKPSGVIRTLRSVVKAVIRKKKQSNRLIL